MEELEKVKYEVAKAKYAEKVCVKYLGIDRSKCEKVFEKLWANMKAAGSTSARRSRPAS